MKYNLGEKNATNQLKNHQTDSKHEWLQSIMLSVTNFVIKEIGYSITKSKWDPAALKESSTLIYYCTNVSSDLR